MTILGIFIRLKAKSGNPHGHNGSVRVNTAEQHPRNLRTCRQHGIWPAFWQPASVHGCLFCIVCPSQSDTSSTFLAISSIAMDGRKDWHLHCTSLCRGKRLQCAWHEPSSHVCSCDGQSAGICLWIQPGSSSSGRSNSFWWPGAGSIGRE